jgi:hypothetical protein
MADLTINEIKEKQKQLEKDLKDLLNKFNLETSIIVRGEINFGFTEMKYQHYIFLKYDNPF